ncbi:hypothetical protein SteCoe_16459 [Stentor coeruleus]|uniref:Uncharacterized protein n=1 Tax=Stentor coeruleus TaxID=5963 RepID=A0A1R2C153_9CILI|nr:hypothetical protein SteCoe_16459 [Stentor coeruleus]
MGVMDDEYFYVPKTVLPEHEQRAADKQCTMLKLDFIRKWVVKGNLDLFKTEQERDWAYIVRKEYRYHQKKAIGEGIAYTSLATVVYSLLIKQVSFKPLALFFVVTPFLVTPRLSKDCRRMFEMLNVGTEYELGAERNRVLEECNRISKRADF